MMENSREDKCCKDCGAELEKDGKLIRGNEGEQITVKRLFKADKKIWIYRCLPCRDLSFAKMVNSHPSLKAKYHFIYGKSVEEQLKTK